MGATTRADRGCAHHADGLYPARHRRWLAPLWGGWRRFRQIHRTQRVARGTPWSMGNGISASRRLARQGLGGTDVFARHPPPGWFTSHAADRPVLVQIGVL